MTLTACHPVVAAEKPDFSHLPCPERVQASLEYWAAEKERPGLSACEDARLVVIIQLELNSLATACPRDMRTYPENLAGYQRAAEAACSSEAADVPPQAADGCPRTITMGDRQVPVPLAPTAEAGAEALGDARRALGEILAQGPCENFGNVETCRATKQGWQEMIAALECHAKGATGKTSGTSAVPGAKASIPQSTGGAASLLPFAEGPANPPVSSAPVEPARDAPPRRPAAFSRSPSSSSNRAGNTRR